MCLDLDNSGQTHTGTCGERIPRPRTWIGRSQTRRPAVTGPTVLRQEEEAVRQVMHVVAAAATGVVVAVAADTKVRARPPPTHTYRYQNTDTSATQCCRS